DARHGASRVNQPPFRIRITFSKRTPRGCAGLWRRGARRRTAKDAGVATAMLLGWRPTTIDADISIVPESDGAGLARPVHPELPGWEQRRPFIAREGKRGPLVMPTAPRPLDPRCHTPPRASRRTP